MRFQHGLCMRAAPSSLTATYSTYHSLVVKLRPGCNRRGWDGTGAGGAAVAAAAVAVAVAGLLAPLGAAASLLVPPPRPLPTECSVMAAVHVAIMVHRSEKLVLVVAMYLVKI